MPITDSSPSSKKLPDPNFLPSVEVDELLTTLQHSHGLYYKMMNLEVWAIVETLDQFFPGSWGRFMANRKVAMKHFLHRHQTQSSGEKDECGSGLHDFSPEKDLSEIDDNFTPPPPETGEAATSAINFPA
ncbi:hypothetical protein BCD67_19240 [Oscillatoriales cyanobacterium USR001]|nr:hypothetical protein BCD67_19240 [Oscillatoriales cyanobacterium USR001]